MSGSVLQQLSPGWVAQGLMCTPGMLLEWDSVPGLGENTPDFFLHKLQLTPLLSPEPGPRYMSPLMASLLLTSFQIGTLSHRYRTEPSGAVWTVRKKGSALGMVPQRSQKACLRTEVTDLIPSLFRTVIDCLHPCSLSFSIHEEKNCLGCL